MAIRADFQMQLLAFVGGAGGKAVAAGAQHFNLVVAGVDSLFWHGQPFWFPGPGAEQRYAAACRVGSVILCGISSHGNRLPLMQRQTLAVI